ncbi:GTPase Era [Nitrospira tepida]|uniref:GTPase Era n=1 Tax=Nitrospira tepida TaxID=2973512 RepID=A0AA86T6M6_9BACT|nr:GTPase Era [Nitrospira tepida]CAI4032597.1 GTPase Era [Nitrospira tepida]
MKSGTVVIIGRPNVGKSTLLNRLLGEKVAIVSNKPQTTRTRILGVAHLPEAQIAFLDTPGLHRPQDRLNTRMVQTTLDTVDAGDVVYVVADAARRTAHLDQAVVQEVRRALKNHERQVLLVLNKIDMVRKPLLLPLLDAYNRLYPWTALIPISAKTGDGVDRLLAATVEALPEGEPRYEADMLTDQTMRMLAAELIREQILHETEEEVPHSVAVDIEEFKEEGGLARIGATVLVEKDSHKGILIGQHGARLKRVGTNARLGMERLFGMKVFLQLWVKVREEWRQDERLLAELGY